MPIFDKDKSKIKMVILTANGFENATRYSIIDQNKDPNDKIIQGMLRRLKENIQKREFLAVINKIHFYEKGNLIFEVKN